MLEICRYFEKHVGIGTLVKEKSLVKMGTPARLYHVTLLSPPVSESLARPEY